jgi:cytochrome c oxidase accessory protein FixG
MMLHRPAQHAEAFAWAASLTGVMYFNFFWFREQLCLIVCPYGRLQSVLTDDDSLVIGYDVGRGEPRGKAGATGAGDCVDCNRCVVVCPTGIDIRNGLQIDCVGCARCIDACDNVMLKLKRSPGLIRYDSMRGFAGKVRQLLRPRVYFYSALGVAGLIALSVALSQSEPFEANVIRLRGVPPMLIEAGVVRNSFEIHVVNKRAATLKLQIIGESPTPIRYVIAMPTLTLQSLGHQLVPVFITFAAGSVRDGTRARVTVIADGHDPMRLELPLIAPGNARH